MIEPTESESRAELDRYCDALICEYIVQSKVDLQSDSPPNLTHTALIFQYLFHCVAIREEIAEIEMGQYNQTDNVLKVKL